jgi:thiamine-monophosphate kinase
MNREDFFISLLSQDPAIGDDAAVLEGWCVSQDAFFEGVHFKRAWMRPAEIAYKAMAVNVSDAVAMAAEPRYALLTVAMPPDMERNEMRELAKGFQRAAEEFGVRIVGGDTIANEKLDISITILARCSRPLPRTGVRPGDWLAYTGELGRSLSGLRRLMRGGKLHAKARFMRPQLRGRFVRRARRHLRAGMDISDGLGHEMQKLARAGRIGFKWVRKPPRHQTCSGEEYEMAVAFSPRARRAVLRIAASCRTPVTIVARAVRGTYRSPCRAHHF